MGIAELEPADVSRGVAVISQDFVRYQLTALENIGLADPVHAEDEAAVRTGARQSGAADFLERLPNGYSAILSKEYVGGTELLVGQWQRVARAPRRDAPLVILDKPSAALDPRAKHELFTDVRATPQDRSALLIPTVTRRCARLTASIVMQVRSDHRGRDPRLLDGDRRAVRSELVSLRAHACRRREDWGQ